MKNSVPSLDISIVSFNSGDFLLQCLKSLDEIKDEARLNIWVVDNNSTDDSIEQVQKKFPKVNLIQNKENLGFSKANNIALSKFTSEYILILNPDSKILPGTIKHMLNFLDQNPTVGAASCKVEKADGNLDWASHRGFPTPWASFKYYFLKDDSLYHLTNQDLKKPHEVDSIVGAFFLTRNSVLKKVGLFDERFFMYGEDLDLCYRIKKAGYKVMYVPEVKIIHYKGVSSGIKKHSAAITSADVESRLRSINAFYEAMIIFYRKNYQRKYPFFVNEMVYLGINFKWWLAKRTLVV
jgi:GT2 family glycosyltransferase